VMENPWVIGRGSLVLGKWHPGFNLEKDPILKCHLWLMMPRFPLQLWTRNAMEDVKNVVGRFILLDDKMLSYVDKRITMILVDFNVSKGLPTKHEISWGYLKICQRFQII